MDRFFDEEDKEKPFFNHDQDDDDDDDEYDDDDFDDIEETVSFINSQDLAKVMQAGVAQDDLKHQLLEKAIKLAEKTWFWSFRTLPSKLMIIAQTYDMLATIIEDPDFDLDDSDGVL